MTTPDPHPGSAPRAQAVASSQHEDTPEGFGGARSASPPAAATPPADLTVAGSPTASGSAEGIGVELIYWAGAKAIAGIEAEWWPVDNIGAALKLAAAQRQDSRFDQLLNICSILVDGQVVHSDALDQRVQRRTRAEVLPPFAGG